MNKHGITKENLMETLPPALREDPSVVALADALATVLVDRQPEIDRLLLYPAIDTLDEPLLDILAYDYKVDWWDPNYSLEEKRRTLKDSWRIHKLLGTKAAVEMAISDIYPNTQVEEWFEYGGNPYGFKIKLDLTGEKWTDDRPRRILERVEFYKSLRSHVDSIQYTIRLPEFSLSIGGGVGAQVQMGVPVEPDTYDFTSTLHAGGAFGSEASLPVSEDTTQPPATTILRTGGVCTIISNLSGED